MTGLPLKHTTTTFGQVEALHEDGMEKVSTQGSCTAEAMESSLKHSHAHNTLYAMGLHMCKAKRCTPALALTSSSAGGLACVVSKRNGMPIDCIIIISSVEMSASKSMSTGLMGALSCLCRFPGRSESLDRPDNAS